MVTSPAPYFEERAEPRDEVLYRARIVLADRRVASGVVVNVSPHGLMIRTEAVIAAGEWIRVQLPVAGEVHAAVRWALGGRLGCECASLAPPRDYPVMLAAMRA